MKQPTRALKSVVGLAFFLSSLPTLSGCGLIFGGDQHVDNKSHDYTVVRLDRETHQNWRVLAPGARYAVGAHNPNAPDDAGAPTPDDTGDIAFEHRGTGTIISVDSVCREYRDASLDELTRYLLLGLKTDRPAVTQPAKIDGVDALDSTVEASMDGRGSRPDRVGRADRAEASTEMPVRVRAVVLRKSGCTYDLMYVARPQDFNEYLPTFERFLKGFHAQ